MANKDNKKFLDKLGVQILWDKINQYFSQIGHRHETSDVNGLDEYMEENAKAIRDTMKVVEELSELPLYPTGNYEDGKVYAYDGKLYRGKTIDPSIVTLDFTKLDYEDLYEIDSEEMADFIYSEYAILTDRFPISTTYIKKVNNENQNGISYASNSALVFELENIEDWKNKLFIKKIAVTHQRYDNEEETFESYLNICGDDLNLEWSWEDEASEALKTFNVDISSGAYDDLNYLDYLKLTNRADVGTITKIELELVECANQHDYDERIFTPLQPYIQWEEIPEDQLKIEDTTPANEDTRKRFYRELPNNNIYVTDADFNPGESSTIYVTHNLANNKPVPNPEDLKTYIDPENVWVDHVEDITDVYGNIRTYINNLQETVSITPIRLGVGDGSGGIVLYTGDKDADIYFLPWYNQRGDTGAFVNSSGATVSFEFYSEDGSGGEGEFDIEPATDLYVENCAKKLRVKKHSHYDIYTTGETGRSRCFIYKIVPIVDDMDNFRWEQVAKVKDIKEAINALPTVARTGCYDDLECKPFIGDVQTKDLVGDEFPIIEGLEKKTLYRYNDSLYTAVVDESGLTLDLRLFSRDYKATGNMVNQFNTFMYTDTIDTKYFKDYFTSGNKFLIQNTKGRGLQLGTGSDYGELLLDMKEMGEGIVYDFNTVTVELQSWNGTDEDIKDYTTDDANIYVEIGDTTFEEQQIERNVDSNLVLFYDAGETDWFAIRHSDSSDLNEEELGEFLNDHNNIIIVNGREYIVEGYYERWDDIEYCGVSLDNYDNLWDLEQTGGYYTIQYKETVTETVKVLTPQKKENVWFKKYANSEDYWLDTKFNNMVEYDSDGCWMVYGGWSDNQDCYRDIQVGDRIKIINEKNGHEGEATISWVSCWEEDEGYQLKFEVNDACDGLPDGHLYVKKTRQINNPVLTATVDLKGTNCDYIKIWTEYQDEPEQYGRRCIIKSIVFDNLRYKYLPNSEYNYDICKKSYWKQISGNGSIKVIDLT